MCFDSDDFRWWDARANPELFFKEVISRIIGFGEQMTN